MSVIASQPLPRCLVPPYLLDRLSRQGTGRVAAGAAHTLQLDARQISLRASSVALTPPGASAAVRADAAAQPERRIHDAGNATALPGKLVRAEGQPPRADAAVDEAYDHLGAVHAYFREVHARDSIDGRGLPLVGSVHYAEDYDNAFWNGAQMVFGDGDGQIFNRFTIALDVVAHELTHGVIDHSGGLVYQGQAGALNESLCDVFGSLVRQHAAGQTAEQADWLIGAGLFTAAVNARALRSLSEPGTAYDDPLIGRDPQPGHMRDFVETDQDNGGVHINSGIPNRAFYLAARNLGGPAWQGAGQVWYRALTGGQLPPHADFASFARLTVASASDARVREAVQRAWADVGVLP